MREGWTYKKLGEVATFINGDRSTNYPSKKDYVVNGIPFVNAGNLTQAGLDIESLNLISQSKYDSLTQGKFVEGDILFCLRGTLGKHSIVQNDLKGAIASSLVIIRTKDGFCNKYVSYYLDYKQPFIERLNNGAAQPNIPAKTMKVFSILLPPDEKEQQRIVSRLDAAFAHIDALKANAKKQLSDAKALFQKALEKAMEPKEGWEEKKLKEISSYSIGLTYKPTDVSEIGTIVLRSSNIQDDKLDLNDIVRVNCPIKENLYVKEGDILMCSRNGSARLVGKVAMLPSMNEKMTYGTFMMTIRSDYNPYLFYFFKSDTFRNQIKHGEANMINQITRYMLDEVYVNTPPLSEQQAIVAQLDQLSEKVKRLQEIQEKTIRECDALKQAILREVFE